MTNNILKLVSCRLFELMLLTIIILFISRVPQPYQYSALSQFDNDPDEEINDLDDHLEMLVEDSSSEDLEEEESQTQAKEIKADSNEVKTTF